MIYQYTAHKTPFCVPEHKPSIYSTMGYITLPDDGEVLTFLDPRLAEELWGYQKKLLQDYYKPFGSALVVVAAQFLVADVFFKTEHSELFSQYLGIK